MLQAGRSWIRIPIGSLNFSIDLILHYGPGVDSASKRNEYQVYSWEVKRGWRVRLTTPSPYVNRLPRKCGILDVSQPHRHPRPITRIALLFYFIHFYSCKLFLDARSRLSHSTSVSMHRTSICTFRMMTRGESRDCAASQNATGGLDTQFPPVRTCLLLRASLPASWRHRFKWQ
jgi:hypothetical protein